MTAGHQVNALEHDHQADVEQQQHEHRMQPQTCGRDLRGVARAVIGQTPRELEARKNAAAPGNRPDS